MKLVTKLFFILTLFLFLFLITCSNDNSSNQTNCIYTESTNLSDILNIYDLTLDGDGDLETQEFTLPEQLTDPNWGLKAIVCEEAGYDLYAHAGENIVAERYSITETCGINSLYLWLLIKCDECICAYKTIREGSDAAPGIWAVDDPCE